MEYEPIIGLEIHIQLKTHTKIFCNCSTEFGGFQNTFTCPICAGFPGTLPVLNQKAVEYAVKAGVALNCTINKFSKFDRKNYFYPDLPKAYQISQFDKPLCLNGHIDIEINGQKKRIRINRIHLEEDAGKLVHSEDDFANAEFSLADYNRCGTPLIEIVSEPDMQTPDEVYYYMQMIKTIMEYIEVSDCNMQEGSLRCDANVSVRPKGEKKLGTKVELKNMNSFKNVRDAVEYEINRQIKELEFGGKIIQETRLWDTKNNITISMRSKEESHDYRYFPEPDLLPIELSNEYIESIKKSLPELYLEKKHRFMNEYGLSEYEASVITIDKNIANYFEECTKYIKNYKLISNWLINDLLGLLNTNKIKITDCKIKPENFAELLALIEAEKISSKIAKEIFPELFETGKSPSKIIEEKGLIQISDDNILREIVKKILSENQDTVTKYKQGNKKVLGFIVGQIMKNTGGKANPKLVNTIIEEEIIKL
ncbi:MAG TPA: Asp-tRNA(Asn)/Glu-tRNA(Gln) amidotransferase subunit GatB [bacterium]|nr:Asp-tRNA(Asn)/Glu-tRNA(Gln) amidotransferase subunit GatB [bacterium]HOL47093.1 Asp-tRNA(Asn)/Glu-tRNA(Gln) amidotransferase subunit GatB [bacterium]HPQ18993.1 Asp-tRNA(Asn)/Glu-tRNA(Gln) amidotransferase subunit GatB [bacterium]